MVDIALEIVRAVVLLGMMILLLNAGRGRFELTRKGWNLIIAGFVLLLFGSVLDITDNFPALNPLIVVGNTETEAVLEKFVGFLGGFILLSLGLVQWIPRVQSLSDEISHRKRAEAALQSAHDTLETRVNERTIQLQDEIGERKRAEAALRLNEQALEARIADLEEARQKLEQQGEDLVRLAADLRLARDQAYAANRAKSEFLANVSHELRTPLNAVIGFSEIMTDESFAPVDTARTREYAKYIHDSGRHLLDLINDILDLSKIESGAGDLREEDVNVSVVVQSVLNIVRERAESAGLELGWEVSDDLPYLRADQRKLKQILANLLTNAIKFTAAGGKVTVRTFYRPESGFVFQVIDTGTGIALDDIPKALAQFGQIDSGLNRRHEGTGLGLPLTKSLVEMHGGSLDLQSELGAGTAVTVRFPAARILQPRAGVQSPAVTDRQAS